MSRREERNYVGLFHDVAVAAAAPVDGKAKVRFVPVSGEPYVEVELPVPGDASASTAFDTMEAVRLDVVIKLRDRGFFSLARGEAGDRRAAPRSTADQSCFVKSGPDGRSRAAMFEDVASDGVPRFRLSFQNLSDAEVESRRSSGLDGRDVERVRKVFQEAFNRRVEDALLRDQGLSGMVRFMARALPFEVSPATLSRVLEAKAYHAFAIAVASQALADEGDLLARMRLEPPSPAEPRPTPRP